MAERGGLFSTIVWVNSYDAGDLLKVVDDLNDVGCAVPSSCVQRARTPVGGPRWERWPRD